MTDLPYPSGHEDSLRAVPRDDGLPPRALVLGATGYLGGRLVPRLLAGGYRVRVLARDPARLAAFAWGGDVEVTAGSATDAAVMAEAAADVDVVFYLIHSMGQGSGFEETDLEAARTVATAAAAASVGRIVYLGGLHPSGVELSPHLRSRVAVGEVLLGSGVPTLVLQAGVVIGSGSASFEMIRHLTDRLPVMTAPRWVHNKVQPISIGDALYYLVEAATATVPESRTWDIGSLDVLEYGDAMQVYADAAGLRRRLIVGVPFLTPTIASLWVGLVTPIPAGLARPLVHSLECDAIMHEHDIDDVIPRPPGGLTGYEDAVRDALRQDGTAGQRGRRHIMRFSSPTS